MDWQLKIAEIGFAILLLGGCYIWVGNSAVENYKDDQRIEQAKADEAQQKNYNKLAGEYEVMKNKRQENGRTIVREVEKIVTKPIYLRECITDDGLLLANKALTGNSNTVIIDATMPSTK